MDGTVKIEIPMEKVISPSSVLKLSGAVVDENDDLLVVPARTDHVEMRFAERVMNLSGNMLTIPEDTTRFQVLDPAEYYFYDTLQPARTGVAGKPYTFLFQPDRNRRPFFPHPGIFEVHFRFMPKNDKEDIVELLFVVYVGGVVSPRKI